MRLLTTTTLFLISSTSALAGDWYASTYGGANFSSFDVDKGWVTAKSDTGYVIGGTVGKRIPSVPGLRIELDASYRSNDIDTLVCGDPLIVTDETWAFLANAAYDIPVVIGGLHPYVMAGAGYGSRTVSVDYTGYEIGNTGLAWQVGAGVNTEIADGVQVGVGYRYFDAPDFDVAPYGGFHDAGTNHSVIAQLTFALD